MRNNPRSDWRAFGIEHEDHEQRMDERADSIADIEREECDHEDFSENQEGDRTCLACGLTTDAPEPGHYADCVCVECHGGELTADND